MNNDPSWFSKELRNVEQALKEAVRALTPNMFEYRPKAGEETVRELLSSAIRTAMALKASASSTELALKDVKAPSFASPEEASALLQSALEGAEEIVVTMDEPHWRTSLRLEGSEIWRGETRATIMTSYLKDLKKFRDIFQLIIRTAAFAP